MVLFQYDSGSTLMEPPALIMLQQPGSLRLLSVEMAGGVHFGGYRSFQVPSPATAPLAEHVAMLTATIWCLQLLERSWHHLGIWQFPITFAFDCLAAGYAANGVWTCSSHQSVHRLTRSLHH